MVKILRQPGKTGIKIKNVNKKLTVDRYNMNVNTREDSYESQF